MEHIFNSLQNYAVWNDLDSQVKDLLTEAISIGMTGYKFFDKKDIYVIESAVLELYHKFWERVHKLNEDDCYKKGDLIDSYFKKIDELAETLRKIKDEQC